MCCFYAASSIISLTRKSLKILGYLVFYRLLQQFAGSLPDNLL